MSKFSQQKHCNHCGAAMVRIRNGRKQDVNSKWYWKSVFRCTGCSSLVVEVTPCTKEYVRAVIARWNIWLKQQRGSKCQICGYDRCWRSLDFHHVDPDKKRFCISNYTRRYPFNLENRDIVLEELKNVVLVCSNCHREIHDGLIKLKEGDYEQKAA